MVTTGTPSSSARKTEVVDVVNGESCADLADFPLENYAAVAANLHGTPVVCGGAYSSGYYQTCYKYTNAGWQQFASMKEERLPLVTLWAHHQPPLTQQCHSCLEDPQVPPLSLP